MAFPLILAGPLLRRVDSSGVSIFVALSEQATLSASLWMGPQLSTGPGTVQSGSSPIATGQTLTRRIGANLHLAVVTIPLTGSPPVPLTPGAFYSYDVIVGGSKSLKTLRLLENEKETSRLEGLNGTDAPLHLALGYDENRLPGFVSPGATIDALRLAHASCRRTNFDGYDAMGWLDDFMKDNRDDAVSKWPQQLFLTGDQIYADDLSSALLQMLTEVGADLLGGEEELPVDETTKISVSTEKLPPLRRGKLIRENAKFSTTDSKNHLASFGEFATMYLAAWSSRAWLKKMPEAAALFREMPAGGDSYLSKWEARPEFAGSVDKWREAKEKDEDKARKQAVLYATVVPKVARALANCSTYMIWDDHEITDDWNLTGRWVTRVYSKAPGKAIIRNGMVAYGLLQAWGNDPAAFATGKNKEFLDKAEALFAGSGPYPAADPGDMERLLGFPGAAPDARAKWHFRVDGPTHRVIVMDSRTRRDTGLPSSTMPPKLLGSTLDEQIPAGPLTDGRELLVVVAPAPVLGPDLFDHIMQPLLIVEHDIALRIKSLFAKGKDSDPATQELDRLSVVDGHEHRDLEGWAGDEKHQEDLFKRLASYERVVLLSGDVHFSCTLALDYWRKSAAKPARIVQLTSSGARNGWPLSIESQFRRNTFLQDELKGTVVERFGWEGEAKLTVPAGQHISPGRRARLKRTPALVPNAGWPTGTTLSQDPDWRWRLSLIKDLRPTDSPGAPPDPPPLSADIVPATSFAGYVDTLKRHSLQTMQKPKLLRTLMFLSNIGIVSFRASGADYELRHEILSAASPGSQSFAANTVHEVSLAPTAQPQPILITS